MGCQVAGLHAQGSTRVGLDQVEYDSSDIRHWF